MRKPSDLTDAEMQKAKEMYLEFNDIAEIARSLDVSRQALSYHANRYWKKELEQRRADLLSNRDSNKVSMLLRMSQDAATIMTRALSQMARRNEPLTLREAKDAALVYKELDNIMRLDEGKPTNITQDKAFDVIEIREKLKADPFSQIEEAEFKQIEESEKEKEENEEIND